MRSRTEYLMSRDMGIQVTQLVILTQAASTERPEESESRRERRAERESDANASE